MAVCDINLYSRALRRRVSVTAIVPLERAEDDADAPVEEGPLRSLYLLHGFTGAGRDWVENTEVCRLAQRYRVTVIMPDGENSFYVDSPGHGHWERFVAEELVDFTRRLLPLSDDPHLTYVAGNSMGGFGALNVGLGHPETFGGVAALSPALVLDRIAGVGEGFEDGVADYAYYASVFGDLDRVVGGPLDPRSRLRRAVSENRQPRMWMSCGTEDSLLDVDRDFASYARSLGARFVYRESAGTHDWDYWSRMLEQVFVWMCAGHGADKE